MSSVAYAGLAHQQRRRAELVEGVQLINEQAGSTMAASRHVDRLEDEKKQLIRDEHTLLFADLRTKVSFIGSLVVLPVVYFVDVLLIGSVAEYFAVHFFPQWPAISRIARLFIPFALLVVEVYIAMKRVGKGSTPFRRSSVSISWTIMGILWAVIPVVFVVATNRVTVIGRQFPGLIIGVAGVALIVHLVVLFGGETAHDAKAFLLAKCRLFVIWLRRRRANRLYAAKISEFTRMAAAYDWEWHSFQHEFPEELIVFGPFTVEARTLFAEVFDQDQPGPNLSISRIPA